jgi:hypothetical protein
MANVNSAANSKLALPRNSVRASNQAIRRPKPAQTGAAIAAKEAVVNSEFHAVPAQTQPCSDHCKSNAERKWSNVKV